MVFLPLLLPSDATLLAVLASLAAPAYSKSKIRTSPSPAAVITFELLGRVMRLVARVAVELVDNVEVSDQWTTAIERSVGVCADSRRCKLALEKADLPVIFHVGECGLSGQPVAPDAWDCAVRRLQSCCRLKTGVKTSELCHARARARNSFGADNNVPAGRASLSSSSRLGSSTVATSGYGAAESYTKKPIPLPERIKANCSLRGADSAIRAHIPCRPNQVVCPFMSA
ncbi:hypothetical protein KC325_g283 [Hortaea werneckii]|nr:hypothetical protein KC325_g283 [Hortaea werneckii]